jgi:hypothetical protein
MKITKRMQYQYQVWYEFLEIDLILVLVGIFKSQDLPPNIAYLLFPMLASSKIYASPSYRSIFRVIGS